MTLRILPIVIALFLAAAAGAEPEAPVSQEPLPASIDPAADEAPICEARDSAGPVIGASRAIEAFGERMRAELAESAEAGDAPIVLNNRGYGYGTRFSGHYNGGKWGLSWRVGF